MKDININWDTTGTFWHGEAVTKSGKRCFISQCNHRYNGKRYFQVYIEGDKRDAATRATMEKVYEIISTR